MRNGGRRSINRPAGDQLWEGRTPVKSTSATPPDLDWTRPTRKSTFDPSAPKDIFNAVGWSVLGGREWPVLKWPVTATSLTWIYAFNLEQAPDRRHSGKHSRSFAFFDVRRKISSNLSDDTILSGRCPELPSPSIKSICTSIFHWAA